MEPREGGRDTPVGRGERAASDHYRLLFENSPQPAWVYDVETLGFLEVNAAMVRAYGWSREELLGMTLRDIRPPEEVPRLLDHLHRGGAVGQLTGDRWHHWRKDRSILEVELHALPVTFAGRPARLVQATDVTERVRAEEEHKQLEEQLLQAQKIEAVGLLAGGIAHDFNNLLTAILGYCELAELRLDEKSEVRRDLHEIRRAGERAAALTRQLLAFSRKQVLQPEVFVPNDEVRELEPLLHRLISENVRLSTQLAADAGRVRVDRNQLHQVLVNLLVNARDAMPSGGKVLIETRNVELDEHYAKVHPGAKEGEYVMIAVSDTGVGMEESVRSRVFEPFFTTKERGKGTGLGLSMVYGVVKQSGGYIWVYSEVGHGTTFKLYFPRVDASVDERHAGAASAAALRGGERMLVAEDEQVVRQLLTRLLEMRGYQVFAAASGEAALATAEQAGEIQLLISDVVMPDMSGRQLADRLVALRPGLKVLFISGYTDESIASHGVLDPGVHLLEKPFTAEVLARRVREVLDEPARG